MSKNVEFLTYLKISDEWKEVSPEDMERLKTEADEMNASK